MIIRFLVALMLICSVGYADIENPLIITEEDQGPLVVPYALKFTNGTVTDNGDGTASVSVTGSSGAPTDATYITQTANGSLSAEQALASLATGIVKNTTTTGVLSIASSGVDYVVPAGNVATATALAANGANCSAGQAPRGVDASGASEDCTAYLTGNQSITVSGDVSGTGTTTITATLDADMKKGQFGVTIDGSGATITTGIKGYVTIPYAMTITGWDILADTSGSVVVDVWKDTYANYPPTVADTIAGSEKPTLSTATKNQDASLSTWTTSVTAGDIIGFKVDSATTVTRVHVIIYGSKT